MSENLNPFAITNNNRTWAELEEFLLFSICVAGKNAQTTRMGLNRLLLSLARHNHYIGPISLVGRYATPEYIRDAGLGCFNNRYRSFISAYNAVIGGLNLRTCGVEDLEKIVGIGPKTARFFLLHSREGFVGAVIDTHVLKFLKDCGYFGIPKSTPVAGAKYNWLESIFIREYRKSLNLSLAEFDLEIWKRYTKNKEAA